MRTDSCITIIIPAVILGLILTGSMFLKWQLDIDQRAKPLRHEIAQNFATKWGRNDVAARWDKSFAYTNIKAVPEIKGQHKY